MDTADYIALDAYLREQTGAVGAPHNPIIVVHDEMMNPGWNAVAVVYEKSFGAIHQTDQGPMWRYDHSRSEEERYIYDVFDYVPDAYATEDPEELPESPQPRFSSNGATAEFKTGSEALKHFAAQLADFADQTAY
jgi:hypothetical protein